MLVEVIDRDGRKYAKITRPRGEGRAIVKSLFTTSDKEAREKVRDSKLEEIARADHADALLAEVWTRLIAGRNVRVRDAVEAYREHRIVIGHPERGVDKELQLLDRFLRFTGIANEHIAAADTAHVAGFVNQEGDQMLPTRVWWLSILTTFFAYCIEQRWIVKNPAAEVIVRLDGLTQEQLVSKPWTPFTVAEVERLLAAVPRSSFWHGAVLLGFHFGLRIGAIATLEESNVTAHVLRIYTTKGRRVVNERLPDELIAWFEEWKQHRPASDLPYVFPSQAAAYLGNGATLSKQFTRLLDKVGIENRVFHSLRKTSTERRWSAELDELGDKEKRALIAMVAKNGFRKVQEMLAHTPGSSVTEEHYLPRT